MIPLWIESKAGWVINCKIPTVGVLAAWVAVFCSWKKAKVKKATKAIIVVIKRFIEILLCHSIKKERPRCYGNALFVPRTSDRAGLVKS